MSAVTRCAAAALLGCASQQVFRYEVRTGLAAHAQVAAVLEPPATVLRSPRQTLRAFGSGTPAVSGVENLTSVRAPRVAADVGKVATERFAAFPRVPVLSGESGPRCHESSGGAIGQGRTALQLGRQRSARARA